MSDTSEDKTGVYDLRSLINRQPCAHCGGSGQLRIDSENINENFEVEKQTVVTECPGCAGAGFVAAG